MTKKFHWGITQSVKIDCSVPKLWKIIEYLNGSIFRRKFCSWIKEVGYDLYINQLNKPSSFVSWRLSEKEDKSSITITVFPYLFNRGYKIVNFLPFYFIVKPLLSKYLSSVVGGLKLYAETDKQVEKNYFGKHVWFS